MLVIASRTVIGGTGSPANPLAVLAVYQSLGIVPVGALTPHGGMTQGAVYRPRDAEHTVLHAVIREHLETFLHEAATRTDGPGLPRFVEEEFRAFLRCGVLAHGFARLRCDGCGLDRLLPFPHPTPPPTDAEVARLLTTIRARILRRLRRHGLGPDAEGSGPDPVAEESPVLAGLSSASVQGRVALGPRAGARSLALGRDPEAEWVTSGGPRHADVEGFDLHANVAVRGEDHERREQLCRYLLRPAVAHDRLRLTEDGCIVLELKRPWQDGTSHLVFEPLDLLARLAALTPRPRINLILYHGVLAPNSRVRAAVVTFGTPAAVTRAAPTATDVSRGTSIPGERATAEPDAARRGWTWAQLMRRAFDLDAQACPNCGGRLQLIATIVDPRTIRALLLSLGVRAEVAERAPPVFGAPA